MNDLNLQYIFKAYTGWAIADLEADINEMAENGYLVRQIFKEGHTGYRVFFERANHRYDEQHAQILQQQHWRMLELLREIYKHEPKSYLKERMGRLIAEIEETL